MDTEPFGACSLLSLPGDVFSVISCFLSPSDICNLILCSKSLCALVDSEKTWLVQCEKVKVLPLVEIVQWRVGISSYKVLCRFLVQVVKPLVGIWVHQNPEVGNVVYVMPGFLSVVGCRIIPQKVGPLWIREGRVMWSPVFEIICCFDGSTGFFLHGRDRERNCVYPGFVIGIEKICNVLLLEVEPRKEKSSCNEIEIEASSKVCKTHEEHEGGVPFWKLEFRDRESLLDLVTRHVALHVVEPLSGRLFPTRKDDEEMLLERRTMLLKMHKFGGNWKHMNLEEDEQLCYNPMQVDINEIWENLGDEIDKMDANERWKYLTVVTPKQSFSSFIRNGINHILGKSSSSKNPPPSRSEIRHMNRYGFLSSGETFGLSLNASYTEMSSYQEWPIMPENHFALYKLPMKNPIDDQEYAGSWGGAYGWPPRNCVEDGPEKALFLLMLTYGESQKDNERVLIGMKILEGYGCASRPNGSAMFVVNIDTPSFEPFPFDADGREFKNSYKGEGIADGYGFRYPSSKPGSLLVISNDLLAFVWQETKKVITLQRLNLEEILKKGLGSCVTPLPPTKNFTYMKRSNSNVFDKSLML
ncbi:putative F-box protein [Cardamine amara subsp. amara]|uniref:F-box protein n=1 Tax=Cardamine amara subsp. amara TaxID=228776 RepID=A0ABD0ZF99_CARAN